MKRIVLFFTTLFLLQANLGFGQRERIINLPTEDERKLRFGYYLGLNSNSYKVNYLTNVDPRLIDEDDNPEFYLELKESFGFNLGFVVDYRLHKNINLRFEPGLMSTRARELIFHNQEYLQYYPPLWQDEEDFEREISGTFIHLPLLFKFSTDRLNNIRPYVIGGVSYDYNFSSNENNIDDNWSDGVFRTTTHNFMYEVGIGMDFYFYFFKFSPSIRGVFSINNELIRDNTRYVIETDGSKTPIEGPWTGPIDFFGTRGIYLNFAFE